MTVMFFRVVTPCGLFGRSERFGETSPYSGLKIETVRFSEALVFTYEYTRRHNPEKHHCQP
jgi:hypothetical protein